MSRLSADDVRHLAKLARIDLSDSEIEKLTAELDVIVESIAKVQEVTGGDVVPTSHPVALPAQLRPDVVEGMLTQQQVLSGAPDSAEGRFRVPAILGEE